MTAGEVAHAGGFWRRFVPVWLAGVLGVLTLVLQPLPPQLVQQAPQLAQLSPPALRALVVLNPLLLVTLLAAVGAATAHRVGLASRLAGTWVPPTGAWAGAVAAGMALALVMTGLDRLWSPWLGPAWQDVLQRANDEPAWRAAVLGIGYGGLAEEVMMRWGLMSLLVWLIAKVTGAGRRGRIGDAVYVVALVVAAVVFAAGHLPALAQTVPLSGALVARTLTLNVVGGLVFGWLYWRRGLEAAMAAHASTHVGFALLRAVPA